MKRSFSLSFSFKPVSILVLSLLFSPVGSFLAALENAPAEIEESGLENSFYEALQSGDIRKSEDIFKRIEKNKDLAGLEGNLAQLMFALGNHYCEMGDHPGALKWFERITMEYGSQIADEESHASFSTILGPKVSWLKTGGKRPWANPDPEVLAKKLMEALESSEPKNLEQMLCSIDTYLGWWDSEYEATPRDLVLDHIRKFKTIRIEWVNQEELKQAVKNGEKILYINTHGWKPMEEFKNIQFAIHAVPEGWEWRGIVLGETQ